MARRYGGLAVRHHSVRDCVEASRDAYSGTDKSETAVYEGDRTPHHQKRSICAFLDANHATNRF